MRYLFPLILIVALSGCKTEPLPKTPMTKHMKQSLNLRYLITDLENLIHEPYTSELEQDRLKIRYAKSFSQEVDALIHSLKDLNEMAKELHVVPQKATRPTIKDILTQLNEGNLYLKDVVSRYRPERVVDAIEQIHNVCSSCHAVYRDRK